MGIATEMLVKNQIKDSGEKTNARLDALLAEQQLTNQLLEQLIQVMQGQPRQFNLGHPRSAR